MRRALTVATLLLVLCLSAVGRTQELLTLTTPVQAPSLSSYTLSRLTIDVDAATIVVELRGTNGERLTKAYMPTTTPTGSTLLHALNTGNFTTTSLIKAIYNRLITDGVLTGTVSGTPQ